MELVNYFRQTL